MKLAFAILTHKEPDALFEKLLDFLNSFPDVTIAVHHDYHKCNFPEALILKYKLHMVHPYFETRWGHISKMPAIINTIKKAADVCPDFDWLISISANCYPIKSKSSILDFFKTAQVDYFMENGPLGLQYESIYKWHYKALFTKKILRIPFFSRKGTFKWRTIRIPINRSKTPFNDTMYPYTGSDWYFLNHKTVQTLLDADLLNHPITHYVARSNEESDWKSSPDEIIIQTFLKNQKHLLADNHYYRFIDWKNAKNWHPNIITTEHWEAIRQSNALFARKFDWNESKDVIDLIDREIINTK